MPAQFRKPALATLALLVGAGFALGQDPTRDLPWRRAADRPAAAACIDAGLSRMAAGWNWEAARMFRELVLHDDKRPLGHLGLALALRSQPNRAARLCWEAIERLPAAPRDERQIVEAYQRYFAVTQQPEFKDSRYEREPGRERSAALIEELGRIGGDIAARLAALERARSRAPAIAAQGLLRSHNSYLRSTGSMPFLIPGYRELLGRHSAADKDQLLARLPRHPQLGKAERPLAEPLPGFAGKSLAQWQPQQTPGFDLQRGLGGRGKYADYAGKPLLVVFFLGFG